MGLNLVSEPLRFKGDCDRKLEAILRTFSPTVN